MTAPTCQPLPRTPEAAKAELWIWQEKLTLAQIQDRVDQARAEASRRALDLARDNLQVVEATIRGEFSDDPPVREEIGYLGVRPVRTYAVGSHGSWGWSI